MKAFEFLKRREIGVELISNTPIRSKRDWRGFLLFVIAGGRVVVMNADLRGGRLNVTSSHGGIIANNQFGYLSALAKAPASTGD